VTIYGSSFSVSAYTADIIFRSHTYFPEIRDESRVPTRIIELKTEELTKKLYFLDYLSEYWFLKKASALWIFLFYFILYLTKKSVNQTI
jgi:hypothetical protein